MLQKLLPLTALLAAIACAGPVSAQALGDVEKGLSYAKAICAECHQVEPGQTAVRPDRAASFLTIANTPGMTPLAIKVWLMTPHKNMPNLIIDRDSMDDLAAYIWTLRIKQ